MAVTQPARPSSRRWNGGRVVAVVAATITALVALALLAGALGLLTAHALLRDAEGYYASSTERFETDTYALTAESLRLGDVGGGVAGGLVERAAGTVRVSATSAGRGPVFVGIAAAADVDRWMVSSAHEEVTDAHVDPFSYDSVRRSGITTPGRPAGRQFWVASAAGRGTQTAEWEVEQGRWAVVIMNADARRGVRADVRVAARPRLVVPVAVALLAGGLLLLAAAGTGLWLALREGRR